MNIIIIDEPLAKFTKEKREKTQLTYIRNETVDITNFTNIGIYLYTSKFGNLDELNQCLEKAQTTTAYTI